MELPEFEITVWSIGHHSGCGRILHVAAWRLEDGLPAGLQQGILPPPRPHLRPEFDHDLSFKTFSVSLEQLLELIRLAEAVEYPFRARPADVTFGSGRHGIHVDRGDHEATIQWEGRLEDRDPAVRSLFQAVADLCSDWT